MNMVRWRRHWKVVGRRGKRCVDRLLGIFGERHLYIEVQRHYDRREEARNQIAIELARSYGMPLLATNAPRYASHSSVRSSTSSPASAITPGSTSQEATRKKFRAASKVAASDGAAVCRSAGGDRQHQRTFGAIAIFADRLGLRVPRYPVPEGETMASFLRKRTDEGARARYLDPAKRHLWQRAQRQIERELGLITKLGLEGYFLIVWDHGALLREQAFWCRARLGSEQRGLLFTRHHSGRSIGMDLLFERFLSEGARVAGHRSHLPSGDDREKAIQYLYQPLREAGHGDDRERDHLSRTFAAREVAKRSASNGETLGARKQHGGLVEYKARRHHGVAIPAGGLRPAHPRIRKILQLCMAVQELPRHLGQHSAEM